jgi:hypothetical protein
LGALGSSRATYIWFNASNQLTIYSATSAGGGDGGEYISSAIYRDPSAWYHIVVAYDSTQATSTNRIKAYVNGSQITAWATSTAPTLNHETQYNWTGAPMQLGAYNTASFFDGYLTEVNFVDGQALTPSSFGETDSATGVWKPKAYSGTYGTNGFELNFSDNSNTTAATLGKDSSGNGNNWTPNNFSVTAGTGNDSLVDSPTAYGTDTGVGGSVRGNYATLNPINKGAGVVLTNGSLDYTNNATNRAVVGTIAVSTGKYYWEVNVSTNSWDIGVCEAASKVIDQSTSPSLCLFGYSCFNGNKYIGASKTASSYDTSGGISGATVLGFAVDFTTGTATIYRDNVSKGVIHTWTPGVDYVPYIGYDTTPSGIASFNFGQRAFAYTAPSGFKALVTTNLPTPTIGATSTTQANDYMNVVLYTGTGSSLGVTGVGFQPDWVWIKERNAAADHGLYDAVRGVQNQLESNTTTAETTEATGLTAFGTDGFTVGALAQLNTSADTYVAWNWNAGGSTVTNTSGTISAQVRANTTSGFSIVTATAPSAAAQGTVGHGLGVTPSMIFLKTRSTTYNWSVYHASVCDTTSKFLRLNDTSALLTFSTVWGAALPTSSVFGITGDGAGAPSETFVAYCFAPVAGYSAFGSYAGNGSADGPFIYTGFRPRFVMVKQATVSARDWIILDTVRNTYNVADLQLMPNKSDAEATTVLSSTAYLDILSNGFKVRNTSVRNNENTATYIYACFAEFPFKFSLAR